MNIHFNETRRVSNSDLSYKFRWILFKFSLVMCDVKILQGSVLFNPKHVSQNHFGLSAPLFLVSCFFFGKSCIFLLSSREDMETKLEYDLKLDQF